MFAKLTRAALIGFVALIAVEASAETVGASIQPTPRVEYRYLGQGAYVFVPIPPAQVSYALTGRDQHRDYWNQQVGQFINAGQGRYFVPPTR